MVLEGRLRNINSRRLCLSELIFAFAHHHHEVNQRYNTGKETYFDNMTQKRNEPPHDKTNEMACAPSEDSDQPGHPPSQIIVIAVRSVGS